MGPLPPAIIQCMSYFAPPFSSRVWPHAQVLLTGAILAPSKRPVSAFLRVMGLDHRSDFQTYHWVLNRCVWSPLEGSRLLLQVLLATFTPAHLAGRSTPTVWCPFYPDLPGKYRYPRRPTTLW